MILYKNLSGRSGVAAYALGEDHISVKFRTGRFTLYVYSYSSAGKEAVDAMKKLATNGSGLNSYISTVKPPYSSKS